MTVSGRDLITLFVRGAAGSSQVLSSGFTYLHVGDSTGSFLSAQDCAGSSGANWFAAGMDAGFPTSTATNVITWQMTASTAQANFHWQEWLVKNGPASSSGGASGSTASGAAGAALNRALADLGTKTNAAAWVFQGQVSITT